MKTKTYFVLVERDEDGMYVAEVPSLPSCYTQGRSVEEAMDRIKEAITLCEKEEKSKPLEFISLQKLEVPA